MNLEIRSGTVGYNNKILVSDGKFRLGKDDKVNTPRAQLLSGVQVPGPAMKSTQTATTHRDLLAHTPTIENRKWCFWCKLPLFDHFCHMPMQ